MRALPVRLYARAAWRPPDCPSPPPPRTEQRDANDMQMALAASRGRGRRPRTFAGPERRASRRPRWEPGVSRNISTGANFDKFGGTPGGPGAVRRVVQRRAAGGPSPGVKGARVGASELHREQSSLLHRDPRSSKGRKGPCWSRQRKAEWRRDVVGAGNFDVVRPHSRLPPGLSRCCCPGCLLWPTTSKPASV